MLLYILYFLVLQIYSAAIVTIWFSEIYDQLIKYDASLQIKLPKSLRSGYY